MRHLIYCATCFLLVICFSCKNEKANESKGLVQEPKEVIDYNDKNNVLKEKTSFLDYDINTNDIKRQMNSFTSSVSSKDSSYYAKNNFKEDDYVGLYYLVVNSEQNIPDVVVGKMIIFNSEKPWVFENTTDKFLEIDLWKKGISLERNKIEIGITKSDLISQMGENYEMLNDDIMLFRGKELTGFFRIKNDTVSHIKVGKYNKNLDYNAIIKKMNPY